MEHFPVALRSDAAALRRCYLRLALMHHPDKQAPEGREAATLRFQRIQAAYEQLDATIKGFPGQPARARVKTVLSAACELGDAAEVRRLLAARCAAVHDADDQGVLPLMFAAKGGSAEVCQLLLDARADVHAANPIGWTALFWAALHGQMSAMEVLRAAGAIISDKFLILVCYTGNAGALEALIASKASAQQARCLCTDESRQNLLHLAVSGLAYEKNAAEAHFRCVQLLLEVQCDVSATEVRGRTVLQHYVMDNHWQSEGLEHKAIHLQAVRCLCVARADPLSEGLLGRSAVAIADGSKLRLLQQELARCRHAGTMVTVERTLPLWMRLASCICGTSWWQR